MRRAAWRRLMVGREAGTRTGDHRLVWMGILCVTIAAMVAGCGDASGRPSAQSTTASSGIDDRPLGGIAMTCRGEGDPTVVLVPGLEGDLGVFSDLMKALPATNRVCSTERAGVGESPPLPAGEADPSAGSAADQLLGGLQERGMNGPYVLLGWSYGGMVVQAFADRHPESVSGILLEDSSVPAQFAEPLWKKVGIDWVEGGRPIDQDSTTGQLADLDFGEVPLFVLTQDELPGAYQRNWFRHQDDLAALSTDSVHVVAHSGHEIHVDALPLVAAAIREVVDAVRGDGTLESCDERFARLGGSCR